MSVPNAVERDQVCLCPKEYSYAGQRAGKLRPSKHQDDCPFFSDYSTSVSETEAWLDAEPNVF